MTLHRRALLALPLATGLTAPSLALAQDEPSRSACSPPSRAPSPCSARTAMRGAMTAVDEMGGMAAGKKIEIVKGSSDASPDCAVRAARKLVEQDGVQDPRRPAVGRRGPRRQGLRQDPART